MTDHRTTDPQAYRDAEVRWYLRNGKYGEGRIARDSSGHRYVIGDWSWNRFRPFERIEDQMRYDIERGRIDSRPQNPTMVNSLGWIVA